MSSLLFRSSTFGFLLFIFLSLGAIDAHAQSAAGVQVQPSIIERSVKPGDVLNEKLTLRNVSTVEQTYYLLRKDISGVAENNTPIFAKENIEKTGYELSSWLALKEDPIVLAPGATIQVPVVITVPLTAGPGSHFGSILASVEPPRLRSNGAAVGYEVGTIVSLRVEGNVIESARIRSFSTDKLLYSNSKPVVAFTTRVENPGNVLIRPHGILEIFNMFGKKVDTLSVNNSLGGVFPGTTHSYAVTWDNKDFAIGRYQATVSLLYGEPGAETTTSAVVSFWVLPLNVLLPVIAIFGFLVLAVYVGVRMHIRRTLERYQVVGRRSSVRRRDSGTSKLAVVAITLLAVTAIFLIGLMVLFA